jgi:hypothetical protein
MSWREPIERKHSFFNPPSRLGRRRVAIFGIGNVPRWIFPGTRVQEVSRSSNVVFVATFIY